MFVVKSLAATFLKVYFFNFQGRALNQTFKAFNFALKLAFDF